MAVKTSGHEHWSSRFAFLMAAIGSSVGLGNLWRFSSEAGAHGGGAFILVYLACVLLIGAPVLICEYAIGRSSERASAVQSVTDVARRSGVSPNWSLLAWLGMAAGFMIVCFYSVVAGWVLAYIPKFLLGAFNNQPPEAIAAQFGELNASVGQELIYFTIFIAITAWFVSRGVNEGIEWAAKILMPLFFLLLVLLCAYSLATGAAGEALAWMYRPDFSELNAEVAVSALGQAFFSIGIGSAIMITYGSYITRETNMPESAAIVALSDTTVAVVAGMAIFPIVFAHGLEPNGGAGLFFQTLPVALTGAPGGNLIGAGFFILAFFAALTSAISLLEVTTAWAVDKTGWSRPRVVIAICAAIWVLGAGCAASDTLFGWLDAGSGKILMPLSGLLGALFVGWRMDRVLRETELAGAPAAVRHTLLFLIRFLAPLGVSAILILGALQQWAPSLYGAIFPS
mgnify:CR=1 FL=1